MEKKSSKEYEKFLRNNFPTSYLLKRDYKDKLYFRVCENNLVTEIFEEKILSMGKQDSSILLNQYRESFVKLLIWIPLNDNSLISFGIRSIIEHLLKLIYSLTIEEKIDSITRMRYRDLKSGLVNNVEKTEMRASLSKLFSKYGNYSNEVHSKEVKKSNEVIFLQNIVTSDQVDYKKLDNTLICILEAYQTILVNLFETQSFHLSTAQRLSISRNLEKDRREYIECNFKQTV